jgi:hypothetical protein
MWPCEVVVQEVQGDRGHVLSSLFEKPLVSRVNRRIDILIVRFWRSTYLVLIFAGSGLPLRMRVLTPVQTGGL